VFPIFPLEKQVFVVHRVNEAKESLKRRDKFLRNKSNDKGRTSCITLGELYERVYIIARWAFDILDVIRKGFTTLVMSNEGDV